MTRNVLHSIGIVTSIFAARCYASAAYAIRCVYVCLCVCMSVTFVHSVKTNKDIFKKVSPSGSHTILDFTYQTGWRYSDGNPSNGGVECRWGKQKSRFWTYIWLLPADNAATSQVLSTRPAVDHGHRPASYDTYIAGRILRVCRYSTTKRHAR